MQSCIGWSGSVEFILFNVSAIWGVKMRLAVVSSDGKNVDLHLGKGHTIYIYDYEDELSFVEMRKLGFKSKIKADDAGLKLVMDEGPIDEVLKRYTDHVEFMKNQSII